MTDEDVERLWLEIPEEVRAAKEEEWFDLDPEEVERRKKLSVSARQRHQEIDPETGRSRFGGPQPGSGRPRKKRVAQAIAEKAQSESGSRKIVKALFDKLDSDDERVALRAATDIVKIEAKEEELQQREQELDDKPRDQIIALLAPVLARLQESGELDLGELVRPRKVPNEASKTLEGTIVEDGDGGTAGSRPAEVA